jgi:glycosyltransferase involved in cell wall biosynthesis
MAGFDVCVVPYVRNRHTETVVPTKVGEYLAMGKPVVSTDLPGVREFASDPEVLTIADSLPVQFAAAVAGAMANGASDELLARRRAVAARLDWDGAVERLSALIEGAESAAGPHG